MAKMAPNRRKGTTSSTRKIAKRVGVPMARRYCNTCELPKDICACAEARAYDKANPYGQA